MYNNGSLWQEEPNSIWFTDRTMKCSICHKRNKRMIEYLIDGEALLCCWDASLCSGEGLLFLFNAHPDTEFIHARIIEYKPIGPKPTRRPVGLSLRYQIMKRDNYRCVFCGKTAKDSKLEIDHIKPVIEGGDNEFDNLQTLCFECNRGKRDDFDE